MRLENPPSNAGHYGADGKRICTVILTIFIDLFGPLPEKSIRKSGYLLLRTVAQDGLNFCSPQATARECATTLMEKLYYDTAYPED
ncbi:hypothetical protein TNCV_1150841 [Trichonephila clavipes]|nr:hypothetical protein TNCV_1150841 [Trichonephila clavipes]